jgi:hypothetical protein
LSRLIAGRRYVCAARMICGTAVAALILPAVGYSQLAPPATPIPSAPPSAAPSAPTPALSSAARAVVDERIAKLQSQLGITEAQLPFWSAFAQAMRDNAASTDALFAQRAGTVATMSAVDNMHSYAQIARAYADNTERLAVAFDGLYARLSDPQKQAADTLFRQQAIAAAKPQMRR